MNDHIFASTGYVLKNRLLIVTVIFSNNHTSKIDKTAKARGRVSLQDDVYRGRKKRSKTIMIKSNDVLEESAHFLHDFSSE